MWPSPARRNDNSGATTCATPRRCPVRAGTTGQPSWRVRRRRARATSRIGRSTVKRRDRHVPKVRMEVHVAFPDTEACFKLATRSAGVATARHQGLPRVRRRVELPGQRHSHERHGCDHEHARNDEPPAAAWSGRSTQHQQRKADDDGRLDARSMEDGLLPEDTPRRQPPRRRGALASRS